MRSLKKNLFFKKRKFNQDADLISKICNQCKEWKLSSEFIPNKSLMDGFSDNCEDCQKNSTSKLKSMDSLINKNGF